MAKNTTKSDLLMVNKADNYKDTVYAQLDMKKEIIDSEKRIFMLIAGVGAGKNYWVRKLSEPGEVAKGYAEHGYKVLLITSRRATADAQVIELSADKNFHFKDLFDQDNQWGTKPNSQKVVCCTNSYIEYYAKHLYDPEDKQTHVWNMFDFIILDEVHSMVCDATFSDAPFHVISFLQYAYRQSKKCRIVMMSGTPKPVKWLYDSVGSKKHVHTINLYDKCRHVEPQAVLLYSKHGIDITIAKQLKQGERIIYFATQTDHMVKLIEGLMEEGIPIEWIGISYSDDSTKDEKFEKINKQLVIQRKCILNHLIKHKCIPQHIRIFITTSKNKEGINIEDTDIPTMIVESHQRDEVVQMAGRVHNGLNWLIILYDAPQHSSSADPSLCALSFACCEGANRALESERRRAPLSINKTIEKFIKQLPFLRYNLFLNVLAKYESKRMGHQLAENAEKIFQKCMDLLFSPISEEYWQGMDFFQSWFPSAKIKAFKLRPLQKEVDDYIKEKGLLERVFSVEARDDLIDFVKCSSKIYAQHGKNTVNPSMKQPKKIMKKLGYDLDEAENLRKGDWFTMKNRP